MGSLEQPDEISDEAADGQTPEDESRVEVIL